MNGKKLFERHNKILGILFLVFLAMLFWYSAVLQNAFFSTVSVFGEFAEERPFAAVGIFVLAAALSAMFSFFSSIPLVPVAVAIFGAELTFFMLMSGWLLGGITAYFVGKFVGYPLLKHFIPEQISERHSKAISPETEFLMVFLFRLTMPAEIPGYILGIIRYHFGKFVLATILAEIPFAFIASYGSSAILKEETVLFYSLAGFGIILFSFFAYLFKRKIKRKNRED